MGENGITREEFQTFSLRLDQAMAQGFTGIHDRLDMLNGRTRLNENAIAVLQERSEVAKETKRNWDGLIGGGVVAVIAALMEWWSH